jgi:hypothetical protein
MVVDKGADMVVEDREVDRAMGMREAVGREADSRDCNPHTDCMPFLILPINNI